MNTRTFSLSRLLAVSFIVTAFGGGALFLTGCASSEEVQEGEEEFVEEPLPEIPVDPMQKMADSLRAENTSLRARVNTLEQTNKKLSAQLADLETKLTEARTRTTPAPAPMRTGGSRTDYDHALSLFKQRNYQEALSVWMGLLNTGAPEGLESNCHYWIGESYYALRQYQEALSHFEHVFGYARTTKRDDAQLKIALCYERMGDRARAKQEYQKLIEQYPASPYVPRAKERAARL